MSFQKNLNGAIESVAQMDVRALPVGPKGIGGRAQQHLVHLKVVRPL